MVLINGKGAGIRDQVPCNDTLSVINVKPNQTYRFRFIGGTAITFASIGFEGHPSLDIIEADGYVLSSIHSPFPQALDITLEGTKSNDQTGRTLISSTLHSSRSLPANASVLFSKP